jgi:hypothetical protein
MLWAVPRERLDDVADPVRKLGEDLARFVPRCRHVHTRLAALVARATNKFDFDTCQETSSLLAIPTLRVRDRSQRAVDYQSWVSDRE